MNQTGSNVDAFAPDPFTSGDGSEQNIDWGNIDEADWNPDAFLDDSDSDEEQTMMPETGESTFVVPP